MIELYKIDGMHCAQCVEKLRAALSAVDGVDSADVTLSPPEARISSTGEVSFNKLAEAVRSVGKYSLLSRNNSSDLPAFPEQENESLYPLFLIVGYLIVIAGLTSNASSTENFMRHFMAGFFLVFSFFKLLDLRGFADAYSSYDILAQKFPRWSLAYPFVEATLGIFYLLDFVPIPTNLLTLTLMLIGAAGVVRALAQKRRIQCACLGTALNLPMTKITLVEDLGMALMAFVMLVRML
jgi:copper chaperone CopZ